MSRHHQQTKKTEDSKQNNPPKQRKNHPNSNTPRNDWLPVHWQNHARGDNIVSSHQGMAENKTTTKKRGEHRHTQGHTRR